MSYACVFERDTVHTDINIQIDGSESRALFFSTVADL